MKSLLVFTLLYARRSNIFQGGCGGGVTSVSAFVAAPKNLGSPSASSTSSSSLSSFHHNIFGRRPVIVPTTGECSESINDGISHCGISVSGIQSSQNYLQQPFTTAEENRPPPSSSSSPSSRTRRNFASIASAALSAALLLQCDDVLPGGVANADKPSDLYYRSKADDEDPLVVFGKSLENMGVVDPSASGGTAGANDRDDARQSSLSFDDIAIPSPSSPSQSEDASSQILGGGDLNGALREKRESRNRAIDPRTHG
mmetsp:Transcript_27526/g.66228  ORF Transcript_27526/g.66228 Transcript_27526/m.66228 type:complete len:257 (+) Transcript_27526:46-816(+)